MTKEADEVGQARKRPKRAPMGEKRRTFTFRLGDDARERVEAAAQLSGRSMSEELEWRVLRSLDEDKRLIEQFGDYDTLKVLSHVAQSWHIISIFSHKKWFDDKDTLDICRLTAINILNLMRAYNDPAVQSKEERPAVPAAVQPETQPSFLKQIGEIMLKADPEYTKRERRDRLAWEAARSTIHLARGNPSTPQDIDKLIDAGVKAFEAVESTAQADETSPSKSGPKDLPWQEN